jgi:hypothetical protein
MSHGGLSTMTAPPDEETATWSWELDPPQHYRRVDPCEPAWDS